MQKLQNRDRHFKNSTFKFSTLSSLRTETSCLRPKALKSESQDTDLISKTKNQKSKLPNPTSKTALHLTYTKPCGINFISGLQWGGGVFSIIKIGWRSIVHHYEFKGLKTIQTPAANSSTGPHTQNKACPKNIVLGV